MATTKKERKKDLYNKIIFIFSFIPLLNFIPFIYMYSNVKNKKWKVIALTISILQVILIVSAILIPLIEGPAYPDYCDVEPYVDERDYMNPEQRVKYEIEGYEYTHSDEWMSSDEFVHYIEERDSRNKRKDEWERRPEIKAQVEKNHNFRNVIEGITSGIMFAEIAICVLAIVYSFIERTKYLKLLKQRENQNSISERMQSVNKNIVQSPKEGTENTQPEDLQKVDINSASEEKIASLKGLTVIDAKKAVSYREEHNGFNTVDEFFGCINAKPHIIASLEDKIIIGESETDKPLSADNAGKRTIDI